MFHLRQIKNLKTQSAIVKTALSITSLAVLAALLLALVPLQPSAIVNGQQNWQLQADRAEKLTAAKNMNRKGETLMPSMIMKANASQSGINVARTNQQAGGAAKSYAVLNVEFKDAASRTSFAAPGVTTLTAVDRFADVFVESDAAYNAVLKSPSVVAAEFATVVDAPPPPPAVATPVNGDNKAIPDNIVRNGYKSVTGKGVIVAIVDTGVDFRHPDFITYDAAGKPTSRLLYLWDTTMAYQAGRGSRAPFSYPNKTSIGTLFTKDQLTAELRRTTPTIPATDLNGHGTACAGISAGNGNGYKGDDALLKKITPGVAPDADIIAVRVDQGDDNDGLENAYLINAASEWMDKVAGAQPLVVSCSYGGQSGPHDGTKIVERHLDARYPLNKQKRAIVFAAGNEGGSPMH
ncbi:MAG: S8 family serine peptidase, partial [Pyrinomonadaceae bacterium]